MRNFGWLLLFTFVFITSSCADENYINQKLANEAVSKLVANERVPGLAISVWQKGKIVWSQGYGYADLEQQVLVDPLQTRFRVGSISKPMAAAALAKIYERGQIDLDASIYTYLPKFPQKEFDFSTRQLAGHIAGVRHYNGTEFLSDVEYLTVWEGLAIFKDDSLLFEPGTKYNYSTYGWNLLSAVAEIASGKDFLNLVQTEVFNPLGLKKTYADRNQDIIPWRTRFYELTPTEVQHAPHVNNSIKWAGGGFLSTTDDLIKFGEAFIKPGYLKKETLDMWLTSQKLTDGTETGYGIGWRVGMLSGKYKWFGHSGGSIGGTSWLIVFPEEEVIVAILSNIGGVNYGQVPFEIGQFFIE